MHDAKCRIQLITVSYMFGLTTRKIPTLRNNAFWLNKDFNIIVKNSNSDLKLKTRSKLGSA